MKRHPIRNAALWFGAMCIFTAPMLAFKLDDHSEEKLIANDEIQAQNDAQKADRLNKILTKHCLKTAGEGAAIVLDDEGNFKDCKQRRMK